jgi:peptidyl-prolyl cis-trans isomerase B (cyclophilin B)
MANPVATFTINGKTVKAELYPKEAPNTVANFISLANKGFFNGLIFHRVIDGFMIQGGDPTGTGMGGPGYAIKGEFLRNGVENGIKHTAGTLSMARASSPNSAGSQFFIMVGKAGHLDGLYAAFGQVTEGMDAVYEIAKTPVDGNDRPKTECRIDKVTVETFGEQYPAPKTL